MLFPRRIENTDVYRVLVGDLAYADLATIIMAATLVGTTWLVRLTNGTPVFLALALAGVVASLAKLALMCRQRKRFRSSTPDYAEVRRWEMLHAAVTIVVAMSAGGVATALFLSPDRQWHLLATALVFAYCAGVVSRMSIRPRIALAAVLVASGPAILIDASWHDTQHRATAGMFCLFVIGCIESIRHIYVRSVRHVARRIDMATLARRDPLTGLVNRLGLREAFRATALAGPTLAIHYLDLNGFKAVNDRLGHAAGDRVLVEVARRLSTAAGSGATVARLGGDEFAVLQGGALRRADVDALAHAIVDAVAAPLALEAEVIRVGASLGYVMTASPQGHLDDMLRAADDAAYRAKRAGGGVAAGKDVAMPSPAGVCIDSGPGIARLRQSAGG